MRGGRGVLALSLLMLTVGLGWAEAPDTSPLPPDRPGDPAAAPQSAPAAPDLPPIPPPPASQPRPRARPTIAPAPQTPPEQLLNSRPAPAASPLPQPRPSAPQAAAVSQSAPAPAQAKSSGPKVGYRGALCGDSAIKGTVLAPITSRVKGCGVAEPVSVEFVAGVRLNPPATIDCQTAEALKTWVNKGLQPAFSPRKVVELRIFGSYMCRTRNNVKGARISEHGRGNAIDIGAFVMDNGQTWTVLDNYNKTIRKAQVAACGPFSTTLGPGSDGFHENHLHLDTAHYNYGPYCH